MNILSLFANIGVAEVYLKELGFNVVLANEIDKRRCDLYNRIFPDTHIICGDINSDTIQNSIIDFSKKNSIDIIMATPPCQGMSNAGRMKQNDDRNKLIVPTIHLIRKIQPSYVFLENVPQFLKTEIEIEGKSFFILDYIKKNLSAQYHIIYDIIDTNDYGVPQTRERVIFLLTKKKSEKKKWVFPPKEKIKPTLKDAIGNLPSLDPFIKDISEKELLSIFPKFYKKMEHGLKVSKFHYPPKHLKRQVLTMMYTPTDKSAFSNISKYRPIKANGEYVRGFANTYKRQTWNKPAYTITMDNVKISSQNNVHPGRSLGKKNNVEIFSDARVFTFFELMKVMTLPEDWNLPSDAPLPFVRRIIGEGIPPLFVKKAFNMLK